MPGACNFSLDVKPIYKLTSTLHAHAKPVIPAGARVLNNLGYQLLLLTLIELLNLYCKTLVVEQDKIWGCGGAEAI